jgi:hypothetical protein
VLTVMGVPGARTAVAAVTRPCAAFRALLSLAKAIPAGPGAVFAIRGVHAVAVPVVVGMGVVGFCVGSVGTGAETAAEAVVRCLFFGGGGCCCCCCCEGTMGPRRYGPAMAVATSMDLWTTDVSWEGRRAVGPVVVPGSLRGGRKREAFCFRFCGRG